MVERSGDVRSQVVNKVTGAMLGRLLKQHVAESAHLNTDEIAAIQESRQDVCLARHCEPLVKRNTCTPRQVRAARDYEIPQRDFSKFQAFRLMALIIM